MKYIMALFLEHKLITSIVLILLSYPIKHYLRAWFKYHADKKKSDHRYLSNSVKNLTNLILVVVLFYLWNAELQRFTLSIAAFAVAIVLATREYIQCFIGFLYVTSTNPFRVGDWVQTGSFFGEVTGTDWAKLTMLEIDSNDYSYTGKTLYIPNNQLITQPIKNLNFLKRYVSHTFTITMSNNYQPYKNLDILLSKAKEYCDDFKDVAERYSAMIERSLDVSLPGPDPSISISTTDLARIKTNFTIFCPTDKASAIENKLTYDFFKLNHHNKTFQEGDDTTEIEH
jgi:small-conductance mechanosensitive channel